VEAHKPDTTSAKRAIVTLTDTMPLVLQAGAWPSLATNDGAPVLLEPADPDLAAALSRANFYRRRHQVRQLGLTTLVGRCVAAHTLYACHTHMVIYIDVPCNLSCRQVTPLAWDEGLAAQASAFLADCPVKHSTIRGIGESLGWWVACWV
jgi:hypothetical protein